MFQIHFDKPIHIHFIGIGGISMSGLAQILRKEGFTISGSDSKRSPLTEQLEAIEAFEDAMNAPSDEPTTDERIAAALEYQVMDSLPDEETGTDATETV